MLVKRLLRPQLLQRNALAFKRRHESNFVDGGDHCTHNDLPVPNGHWDEWYSKQNARYNTLLASSIIALIGTIILMKSSGRIDMNYSVPKLED